MLASAGFFKTLKWEPNTLSGLNFTLHQVYKI